MNLHALTDMLDQAFSQATLAAELSTAGETDPKAREQRPMAPQEVRWYTAEMALVECVMKLPVAGDPDDESIAPKSLRIERYGPASAILQAGLDVILEAADTGERSPYGRRSYQLGETMVTPAPAAAAGPGAPINDAKFARLCKVATEPGHDFDDRTKAIELLAAERSERVIEVFLRSGSFYALDLLSQWGITRAAVPLDELIAKLRASGDRMIDRVLVARQRLNAWVIAASAG